VGREKGESDAMGKVSIVIIAREHTQNREAELQQLPLRLKAQSRGRGKAASGGLWRWGRPARAEAVAISRIAHSGRPKETNENSAEEPRPAWKTSFHREGKKGEERKKKMNRHWEEASCRLNYREARRKGMTTEHVYTCLPLTAKGNKPKSKGGQHPYTKKRKTVRP